MFSGQHVTIADLKPYDFEKSENAAKWRGLFTPGLAKVLSQVHPKLTAGEDALLHVESLCLRLLAMLCAAPTPHTIQDIKDRVGKTFPPAIEKWAINEARDILDKSKKKKLVLPVDRVHAILQKEVLQYKIDSSVSQYLVAVLEYISADILKLVGNYVKQIEHDEISCEDIKVAIYADDALMDLFYPGEDSIIVQPSPLPETPSGKRIYEELVKELIHDEKQYQRDLHMIIRVFREELMKIVKDPKELDMIFSNIMDIYEVTATFLGSLEDVIEMAQEQGPPCVGSCFEELAEAAEFDAYLKYAKDVTSKQSRNALTNLLAHPDASSLMSAGHGFREAVKYYLPKLLLVPIWHSFLYLDYVSELKQLSPSEEDRESFVQVLALLMPLLTKVAAIISIDSVVRTNNRARRQLTVQKTQELQKCVEHCDNDVVGQYCNEFIREDTLAKLGSGKRVTERKVYLFDGLLVLCKAITRRQTTSVAGLNYEFRLKEKFFMRRLEVIDRADTDELKNSFEISPRDQQSVVLIAKTPEHKIDWMADLIMVSTKTMLDRILDSILLDIEKKHPLRLPSPEIYNFAVPDSPDNIILEEKDSTGVPLIKGATLNKLIERLTYHIYADPMFVRTFLTTYRYFCEPHELLLLLEERFDIPDPSLVYPDQPSDKDMGCEPDKMHKTSQREDWKRYKKEYVQPVQFRVLNVLRHWVDHHFYDFEKDTDLLNILNDFLSSVNVKSMRKWVCSVQKIVERKTSHNHKEIQYAYNHKPPAIEYHLQVPENEFNLLTLHPLELARQLTLLEFELYKNVKPSELVGSPWTKKEKEIKSPNLLKLMKHATNMTRWLEKSIIEAENYEERVAMVTRAIELMMVMLDLNNFNGILSIIAAMGSASVFRLKLTFAGLPSRYERFLEECRQLNTDGHLKKYKTRLRSINPPCVPFFGRYLTEILLFEEGNPDFIPNTALINFSKRRKVAETIGEIQQYQNQPYCLKIDPKIRNFLCNLDPFKGMSDTEISDYLYEESLRIEPKGCKQPPKFARKWPDLPLKSPGIKPRRQSNNSNNSSNNIQSGTLPSSSKTLHTNITEGEQSPTAISTTSTHYSCAGTKAHDFAIFNNVQIQSRNGNNSHTHQTHHPPHIMSHHYPPHTGSNLTESNTSLSTIGYSSSDTIRINTTITAPQLPIRSNSIISISSTPIITNADSNNSPSCASINSTMPRACRHLLNPTPETENPPDDSQHLHNNAYGYGNSISPPANHQPQTVSPRTEYCAMTVNRSPFQNTSQHRVNLNVRDSGVSISSIDDFSTAINHPVGDHLPRIFPPSPKAQQQQQQQNSFSSYPTDSLTTDCGPVPISPHVNVPNAHNFNHVVPPPLPPRRRERKECAVEAAHLAQKRQTPDAPQLPPRDTDLSPPPLPPRSNQPQQQSSSSSGSGSITPINSEQNNLKLPHTSTIMMRRNSAMEKSVKTPTNNSPSPGSQSAQSSSSTTNSPATPSPMTPATPISPQTMDSGGGVGGCSIQQYFCDPPPIIFETIGMRHFVNHRPHFPNKKNTSPIFSSSGETTPKLPPKPRIGGHCYPEKSTMFPYPSTNHE